MTDRLEIVIRAYEQGDGATLQENSAFISNCLVDFRELRGRNLLLFEVGADPTYYVAAHGPEKAWWIAAEHMRELELDHAVLVEAMDEVTLVNQDFTESLDFYQDGELVGNIWEQFVRAKKPGIVAYPMDEL